MSPIGVHGYVWLRNVGEGEGKEEVATTTETTQQQEGEGEGEAKPEEGNECHVTLGLSHVTVT